TLREVFSRMQPLVTEVNPFGKKVRVNMPVTWVRPELVCQLKYTEATDDGSRRHPVFMGLREDKPPEQVHPEAPVVTESAPAVAQKSKPMKQKTTGGRNVRITNPDKVYWPEEGYTKGDMIDYYN